VGGVPTGRLGGEASECSSRFLRGLPATRQRRVSTLGRYNEHLVRDYGALDFALAVLLVAAAVLLERRLVQVALLT
jgi:hypothetical protein